MLLSKLRSDLDLMPSPVPGRPGLLMRDFFRYSPATLIIPPPLIPSLRLFNGSRSKADLQSELTRTIGEEQAASVADHLAQALSDAGFLEDDMYRKLKRERLAAFEQSAVRVAAHAGSAYPAEIEPLQMQMRQYLGEPAAAQKKIMAIAAPHVSPEGGWQSYSAAYRELTPDLRDRTFVILGTSHYGQADRFGLTRKPFETPWGTTRVDRALVDELSEHPATLLEDYCHAVEHSIEFQVVFLQSIYGADVRILPILCGSFARSIRNGGIPEDSREVAGFLAALRSMAERERDRLFWVMGVDMAHMGVRYGDKFAALAEQDEMRVVRERDLHRIDRINAGDARGFWQLVKENQDDLKWCGSSPFYTFMQAVPQARGTLKGYQQWNIDERSVVSFAGMSFEV
jgi:AmmeMemoRadiSam system protein B